MPAESGHVWPDARSKRREGVGRCLPAVDPPLPDPRVTGVDSITPIVTAKQSGGNSSPEAAILFSWDFVASALRLNFSTR
jgi:hypothetical protein